MLIESDSIVLTMFFYLLDSLGDNLQLMHLTVPDICWCIADDDKSEACFSTFAVAA
jgi:hypothetical protein